MLVMQEWMIERDTQMAASSGEDSMSQIDSYTASDFASDQSIAGIGMRLPG